MPTRPSSGPWATRCRRPDTRSPSPPSEAEALRLARPDKPALVLVAANLPGVDGFTVVTRLRAEDGPSTHTCRSSCCWPRRRPETRGKALRSGADDYLIKPFHPAELMARMRSLLARYQPDE